MSFEASVGNRLSHSKHDVPETDLDFHARPENYTGSNIHALNRFVLSRKRQDAGDTAGDTQQQAHPMQVLFDRYRDVIVEEEVIDLSTSQSVKLRHDNMNHERRHSRLPTIGHTADYHHRAMSSSGTTGNRSGTVGLQETTQPNELTYQRSTTVPAFERSHFSGGARGSARSALANDTDEDTLPPYDHSLRKTSLFDDDTRSTVDKENSFALPSSYSYQLVSTMQYKAIA